MVTAASMYIIYIHALLVVPLQQLCHSSTEYSLDRRDLASVGGILEPG